MAAPVLQRSVDTFRRSGSSGLVWEDRLFSEDPSLAKIKTDGTEIRKLRQSHSVGTIGQTERSRTNGHSRAYLSTMILVSPAVDPPSPRLPVCGLFGFLQNSGTVSSTAKVSKPCRR